MGRQGEEENPKKCFRKCKIFFLISSFLLVFVSLCLCSCAVWIASFMFLYFFFISCQSWVDHSSIAYFDSHSTHKVDTVIHKHCCGEKFFVFCWLSNQTKFSSFTHSYSHNPIFGKKNHLGFFFPNGVERNRT